ncbi:hypothetical protein R3P38DRAFT_3026596 [Favolaschia claudopus]|uniref:Uncharacterized protein n=1 Tax=Favolaschia claudopus TaxID=2862362 RepID=A0AAW0AHF7_9AGAR
MSSVVFDIEHCVLAQPRRQRRVIARRLFIRALTRMCLSTPSTPSDMSSSVPQDRVERGSRRCNHTAGGNTIETNTSSSVGAPNPGKNPWITACIVELNRPKDTVDQERHFVSVNGEPFYVPAMTVAKFCQTYNLSDSIRARLEQEEFQTAGKLLEVSETTLQTAGFKSGQIADVKTALKEFLIANSSLAAAPTKEICSRTT